MDCFDLGDDRPPRKRSLKDRLRMIRRGFRRFLEKVLPFWFKPRFPIIRLTYPSSIRGQIFQEWPMAAPDYGEWVYTQEVRVFDPRLTTHPDQFPPKIIIQRIITRKHTKPPASMLIAPVWTVELLGEYSFEEWDAPLLARKAADEQAEQEWFEREKKAKEAKNESKPST